MDKDSGLKVVYRLAFGSLSLFNVKYTMLLEKVEAQDSFFVLTLASKSLPRLRLEQIVQLGEVIKVKFFAGVNDGVNLEQFL